MKIVRKISIEELKIMLPNFFGDMVKAVVDIERSLVAVDAELHADLEKLLLDDGSAQKNLWGINLYPELEGESFIEFDSMINIRPTQNNRSRYVEDPEIRSKIITIIENAKSK